MTSFSSKAVHAPTAHRSVEMGEVQPLDNFALMHDLELGPPDVQDRGDVLMHELRSEDDPFVEHLEHSIRANEPDELDPTAPRQAYRHHEARREQPRSEAQPGRELVGGRATERGIAVIGVVKALEAQQPPREVREIAEALAAEEALVEGVVEVLDDTLAPGLAEGDEHRYDPEGQTEPDRPRQPAAVLRDEPVVELEPLGDAQPTPDPDERGRRFGVGLARLQLAGGRPAADVDDVEHVEGDGAT